MKQYFPIFILLFSLLAAPRHAAAQVLAHPHTYCNPLNLDYGFTPIPNFSVAGRHRATADPLIVPFKGKYYLFSTNQWGYWWSTDLASWHFVSRKFLLPQHKVYDELCAPAAWAMGDTLFVIGSTYSRDFPIWMSTHPETDTWQIAVDSFLAGAWDPGFFYDDDKRLYLYNGSSNFYPMYMQEVNPKTFELIGQRQESISLHDEIHGWERFGEYNDNNFLEPFMEGSWVNKYKGKYYLQYGAPGTEFSGYADGVYVSDHPLGPFRYQAHNPFCYKPGGFIRGAGHGGTFQDNSGAWWHVTTGTIAVKNNFERRLVLFPTDFDADGILWSNTAFGDYPTYLPEEKNTAHMSRFTGWMLLNYQKPVKVSSTLGACAPNYAVDEDIKTYWSAATDRAGEWIVSDLGAVSEVRAIQINYADQDVDTSFLGKIPGIYHQYKLYYSLDGKKWTVLADKSRNRTDVPHDYLELATPVRARYIKMENIHMAAGKFALSGLRVFGKGPGKIPGNVTDFVVLRQEADPRNAWIKWNPMPDAYAYNICFGIAPDKLYHNMLVYGKNEYYLKALDRDRPYFFTIQAVNENGIGPQTAVLNVK